LKIQTIILNCLSELSQFKKSKLDFGLIKTIRMYLFGKIEDSEEQKQFMSMIEGMGKDKLILFLNNLLSPELRTPTTQSQYSPPYLTESLWNDVTAGTPSLLQRPMKR